MITVSAVQALGLLGLYLAASHDVWPASEPATAFPAWTVVLVAPLMLILALERDNGPRLGALVGGFAAALGALGAYVGIQAEPSSEVPAGSIGFWFVLSMAVVAFKGLIYLQPLANREPVNYARLFTYSWRDFLTAALAAAFVGGVALIFVLWAGLFSVVDVTLFAELFVEPAFLIPVLAVSFGLGAVIFRRLSGTIDGITQLLDGLFRLLLPLLMAVVLAFLATLPFVGLAPLWATGSGTSVLLWLGALVLFCCNAVFQTGRTSTLYPSAVRVLIAAGVLAIPAIVGLGGYGLWLRVLQYGWTVERCWAALVAVLLAALSLGYLAGVVRYRLQWPRALARVNTGVGVAMLVTLLVANSPLMDFRKVSLASQTGRVERGELTWSTFDHFYAWRHLGRPAYLLRQELLAGAAQDDDELRLLVERPRPLAAARPVNATALGSNIVLRPAGLVVPEDLKWLVEQSVMGSQGLGFVLIGQDLDGDDEDEYALLAHQDGRLSHAVAYFRSAPGQGWMGRPLTASEVPADVDLTQGSIRTLPSSVRDLEVDGLRLRVR
ncbi:MAG: DUF4153 domain-containing protein [Pseudomonadales bacterium]